MLFRLLLFVVLSITINANAETNFGYVPNRGIDNSPLWGVWRNKSVYTHGKNPARDLWQQIEITSDGEMVHDYYYTNPASNGSIPFERLFSRWSAGYYIDPDSTFGKYLVLEINPYESRSLKNGSKEYRSFRNNFLPVYRRFSLTASNTQLALSEPFILVVPFVDQLRSFPSDATFLNYTKFNHYDSAVTKMGWAQIKIKMLRLGQP